MCEVCPTFDIFVTFFSPPGRFEDEQRERESMFDTNGNGVGQKWPLVKLNKRVFLPNANQLNKEAVN